MRVVRPRTELGDSFVVTLLAVVVLLAAFLMATNLVVDEYGKGVVRTAVDEGAQAGALAGDPTGALGACRAKENEVMSGLLTGKLGRQVRLGCAVQGDLVVASADGDLPGWLPPVPPVSVRQVGIGHLEQSPSPVDP